MLHGHADSAALPPICHRPPPSRGAAQAPKTKTGARALRPPATCAPGLRRRAAARSSLKARPVAPPRRLLRCRADAGAGLPGRTAAAWSHRRSLVAPATLPPKATAIARYSGLVRRSPPHAAASRQGCTGGQAAAARAASAGRRAGARGGDVECKLRAPPSSSRGWPSDCARAPACGRGGKGPAARPQPGRPPPYPPIARAAIGPATDPRR